MRRPRVEFKNLRTWPRWLLVILLLIVVAMSAFVIVSLANDRNISSPTSLISDEVAVNKAIAEAQAGGPWGTFREITQIRGRIMTYSEAIQSLSGRPPDPNSSEAQNNALPVWLIVLEGRGSGMQPGAPGTSDIPREYDAIALVLNAWTGDVLRGYLLGPDNSKRMETVPTLVPR